MHARPIKKKEKTKIHPEAIITSGTVIMTFARVLREVTADPDLEYLTTNVNRIWGEPKRESLLVLKRSI